MLIRLNLVTDLQNNILTTRNGFSSIYMTTRLGHGRPENRSSMLSVVKEPSFQHAALTYKVVQI
jgi:hypothetical protein